METLILIIHIVVSLALVLFILLQSGKGGGVSAAFGGGAGAALGQRSAATVLSKLTVILSVIFGLTSMSLAILSTEDRTLSDQADMAPISTKEAPSTSTKEAPVTKADPEQSPAKEAEKTSETKPTEAPIPTDAK